MISNCIDTLKLQRRFLYFFQYGWTKDEQTKTLHAIMLPPGVKSAPDEVLKINSCGCTCEFLINMINLLQCYLSQIDYEI